MVVTSARETAPSVRECPTVVSTVLFVDGLLLLDLDHRPAAPVATDDEVDDEESEDSRRRSLRSTSRSSPPNNSLKDDDVERCFQ